MEQRPSWELGPIGGVVFIFNFLCQKGTIIVVGFQRKRAHKCMARPSESCKREHKVRRATGTKHSNSSPGFRHRPEPDNQRATTYGRQLRCPMRCREKKEKAATKRKNMDCDKENACIRNEWSMCVARTTVCKQETPLLDMSETSRTTQGILQTPIIQAHTTR